MNNKIKHIIVHCAYTPPSMDIGVKEIDSWHRKRGWLGCGYHAVITRAGVVELGRPADKSGAHVRGMNSVSRGICLVGGMNRSKDGPEINYTDEQYKALRLLINQWQENLYPIAKVSGHTDWDKNKTCPNFDAAHWFETEEIIPTF